jgi:hypothetical protein
MFVVKQFAMVERAKGFVEAGSAVLPNLQKKFGKARSLFAPHAVETFANSFGDGGGHALTSKFGQLFGEFLGRPTSKGGGEDRQECLSYVKLSSRVCGTA